ncbi:MAG: replicative DNA helicase [Burkholderiales bacterium]
MASVFSQPSSPSHYGTDSIVSSLKLPPHSIEAEQSVLGGLLLNNEAWDRIGDMVADVDFYRDDHRKIYRAISRLIEQNKPADVLTVAESLQLAGELQNIGGINYLQNLSEGTPSAANIRLYAEIVRERSIMRSLARAGEEIADSSYSPSGREARQLLDDAEKKIFDIAEMGRKHSQGFQSMEDLLGEVMTRLDELSKNPTAVVGKETGFVDLDNMTSGMQDGDLIIVAGRPSMGKAQPLDARIKTTTGWKAMGQLQLGDAVASVDGDQSIVTGIFPQGERQVYRISFADGRSTECCDEHLWTVRYRDWSQARTVTTAKLREMLGKKRYKNRLWVDEVSGEFGHDEPLALDPWVLGTLLGDGKLSATSVTFSAADEEMAERLQSRIGGGLHVKHAHHDDWRVVGPTAAEFALAEKPAMIGAQVTPLMHALRQLDLWGISRVEKFIPEIYLLANRKARLDLLRGLLDTGGWVEKWGAVRFATSSWRLANDVLTLARSLGAYATLKDKRTRFTHPSENKQGEHSFVVNISHANPKSLFLLLAKQARAVESCQRRKRLNISSIVPTRVAATQCISVSHPSRLYVTDEYIPTHNTAFSLNLAEHVAVNLGLPVLIYSMEMGGTQIAGRFLSSISKVDQQKLRTGQLDARDWDRLSQAMVKLNTAPIHIDETPALNALELRARARRMWRMYDGLGLIVVDYLQLMSSTASGENRATEISEISRSLKALAKELKVPVVALSQLNRSLEQRPNKRPVMSDLRESGAIEQDADVIIFIYRDEVYNPDTPDKGTAEIIIGKQRNGPIGTVRLTFLGQNTRFENYAGGGGGY